MVLTDAQKQKIVNYLKYLSTLTLDDINTIHKNYTNPFNPNIHNEKTLKNYLVEFIGLVLDSPLVKDELLIYKINEIFRKFEAMYDSFVNKGYLAPTVTQILEPSDSPKLVEYYKDTNNEYNKYKFLIIEKLIHYLYDIHTGKYDCLIKDKSYLYNNQSTSLANMYENYTDINQNQKPVQSPNQNQTNQNQNTGNSYVPSGFEELQDNQLINGVPSFHKLKQFISNYSDKTTPLPTDRIIAKEYVFNLSLNLDSLQRMTPQQRHDFTESVIIDYIRFLASACPLFTPNFKLNFKIQQI